MIQGKDLKVYEGSGVTMTAIALAKSCTIVTQSDALETSSPSSSRARTYTPGRTGWTVTVNKLMSNMKADLLRIGGTFTLTMMVNENDKLTGTAICTEVQLVATVGNLVQCSVKFLGSGELA